MFDNIFGKKKPKDENKIASERTKKEYHSIQVIPCENSCESSSWISSKTYLVSEPSKMPRLPLESCNKMDECSCKFKHYDDRRHNEDRRCDSVVLLHSFGGNEHREQGKGGRRNDDYVVV